VKPEEKGNCVITEHIVRIDYIHHEP